MGFGGPDGEPGHPDDRQIGRELLRAVPVPKAAMASVLSSDRSIGPQGATDDKRVNRFAVVRYSLTDSRAGRFLKRDGWQLPTGTPGIVVLNTSGACRWVSMGCPAGQCCASMPTPQSFSRRRNGRVPVQNNLTRCIQASLSSGL
jgi:hypothetical protein